MDLSKYVDVANLKRALKGEGCTLPEDFPILLEKHLRILAHRYKKRENPWNHKSLKTVPNTQRSFFAAPRSEWGDWLISYNDAFIRGWKKEILVPKDVVPIDNKLRGLTYQLKHVKEGLMIYGVQARISNMKDRIPRTKNLRRGSYAYLTVQLVNDGKMATFGFSHHPNHRNGATMPTYKGWDHLHIFGELAEVVIIKRHLLLKDDKFFLFVR